MGERFPGCCARAGLWLLALDAAGLAQNSECQTQNTREMCFPWAGKWVQEKGEGPTGQRVWSPDTGLEKLRSCCPAIYACSWQVHRPLCGVWRAGCGRGLQGREQGLASQLGAQPR